MQPKGVERLLFLLQTNIQLMPVGCRCAAQKYFRGAKTEGILQRRHKYLLVRKDKQKRTLNERPASCPCTLATCPLPQPTVLVTSCPEVRFAFYVRHPDVFRTSSERQIVRSDCCVQDRVQLYRVRRSDKLCHHNQCQQQLWKQARKGRLTELTKLGSRPVQYGARELVLNNPYVKPAGGKSFLKCLACWTRRMCLLLHISARTLDEHAKEDCSWLLCRN